MGSVFISFWFPCAPVARPDNWNVSVLLMSRCLYRFWFGDTDLILRLTDMTVEMQSNRFGSSYNSGQLVLFIRFYLTVSLSGPSLVGMGWIKLERAINARF